MRTTMRLLLALLGVLMAAECHGAPRTALIGDAPVKLRFVLPGNKAFFLQGHLRFDLRIERGALDSSGRARSETAVLNNLSLRIDDVPPDDFVVSKKPAERVRVGISASPLQRVPISIDSRKGVIQFSAAVVVEPPSGLLSSAFGDQTGAPSHNAKVSVRLWIPQWLKAPTGIKVTEHLSRLEVSIRAPPYQSPLYELLEFTANADNATMQPTLLQAVDATANAVLQTICVQPIAVAKDANDPDPAGHVKDINGTVLKDSWIAQKDQIKALWAVATSNSGGVIFQDRPWKSYVAPHLKVIKAGEETRLPNDFPDSEPGCIEIYFIEKIEDRDWNGAATNGRGTAEAQVIFSDEVLSRGIFTRLAHELGHLVRIPHTDQPRGGDQYCGSTGTIVCVYVDWDKPNLLRNSANNIEKIIVPAGVRGPDVILPIDQVPQPVCVNSADCGLCEPRTSQGADCR